MTDKIDCYGFILWSYKACPSVEKFDIDERPKYEQRLGELKISSGSVYENDWSNRGFTKEHLDDRLEGPRARARTDEWF